MIAPLFPGPQEDPQEDSSWLQRLERAVGERVLIAMGLELAKASLGADPDPPTQRLIAAGHDWVACPCDAHGNLCAESGGLLGGASALARRLASVVAWASADYVRQLRPPDPLSRYLQRLAVTCLHARGGEVMAPAMRAVAAIACEALL